MTLNDFDEIVRIVDFFSNNLACGKDWSSINLDFVIGGIDGCGTASLHMNLEKHAETWLKIGDENCVFTMGPGICDGVSTPQSLHFLRLQCEIYYLRGWTCLWFAFVG